MTEDPTSTKQVSGSLTLEVGPQGDRKRIVLDGQVGQQIQVGFRAKDGDPEIPLGTFKTIIVSVAEAFGVGSEFATDFEQRINDLGAVNADLKKITEQLLNAQLFITDMAINASSDDAGTYSIDSVAFGFRVEFSELKLGPIQVVGFGVLFEYTPASKGKAKQGLLTTRPG
jgi:hypothetical protein